MNKQYLFFLNLCFCAMVVVGGFVHRLFAVDAIYFRNTKFVVV